MGVMVLAFSLTAKNPKEIGIDPRAGDSGLSMTTIVAPWGHETGGARHFLR